MLAAHKVTKPIALVIQLLLTAASPIPKTPRKTILINANITCIVHKVIPQATIEPLTVVDLAYFIALLTVRFENNFLRSDDAIWFLADSDCSGLWYSGSLTAGCP